MSCRASGLRVSSMRVNLKKPSFCCFYNSKSFSAAKVFFLGLLVLITIAWGFHQVSFFVYQSTRVISSLEKQKVIEQEKDGPLTLPAIMGPCAINLYGLPRQFQTLVLPSVVEHIIRPNLQYKCDYYIHYYNRTHEDPNLDARGADKGRGGHVDATEIYALESAIYEVYNDPQYNVTLVPPIVQFVQTTDEDFLQKYQELLPKLHTARLNPSDAKSPLLYIPTSSGERFSNATLHNILKMWLGQEAVWNLMESSSRHYSRVAMFRNDMLYVTPMDIYQLPNGTMDRLNQYAVVPDFANFPVNDRMIYGPYDAVRIWAAGRLPRLHDHVHRVAPLGHGIHDELFLFHTIFPAIRDAGIPILTAPLCFLRVRSDQSIRLGDCGRDCVHPHNRQVVEGILQRPCRLNTENPQVAFLECPDTLLGPGSLNRQNNIVPGTWQACAPDSK